MKKQRSASPSQAMPSSAPSDRTWSMMNVRFSSSSGLGSWSGISPSGVQYSCTCSIGSVSRIGPAIWPAMPLPPSSTTLPGRTCAGSMNASASARNGSAMSSVRDLPGRVGGGTRLAAGDDLAQLADARVAGQRQRAAAHELRAGVRLGVVRGGAHQPAVQLAASRRSSRASRCPPGPRPAPTRPRRPCRRRSARPGPAPAGACRAPAPARSSPGSVSYMSASTRANPRPTR